MATTKYIDPIGTFMTYTEPIPILNGKRILFIYSPDLISTIITYQLFVLFDPDDYDHVVIKDPGKVAYYMFYTNKEWVYQKFKEYIDASVFYSCEVGLLEDILGVYLGKIKKLTKADHDSAAQYIYEPIKTDVDKFLN